MSNYRLLNDDRCPATKPNQLLLKQTQKSGYFTGGIQTTSAAHYFSSNRGLRQITFLLLIWFKSLQRWAKGCSTFPFISNCIRNYLTFLYIISEKVMAQIYYVILFIEFFFQKNLVSYLRMTGKRENVYFVSQSLYGSV